MAQELKTLADVLFESYAGLQMAAFASGKGKKKYSHSCYAFRATILKKYRSGEMAIGDLYRNLVRQLSCDHDTCWYCGRPVSECGPLTADHVFPRAKGGAVISGNLIMACRSCNSSKGTKDLLAWYAGRGEFPPMRVLAHYLKLANQFAVANHLMDIPLEQIETMDLPFDYKAFPLSYPPPGVLSSSKPIRIPGAENGQGVASLPALPEMPRSQP